MNTTYKDNRISVGEVDSNVPHLLIDCTIPDLFERMSKAKEFKTVKELCIHLGCTEKKIFNSRQPGKYVTDINGKGKYAIRLLKK